MHLKKNHLKFSMKLLLDRNIVLVEHPGHEPQLFMPVLLDNSIVLQNIIFDNNAPIPHRIRPKLPVLKASAPSSAKMKAHSHEDNVKINQRNQRDNSPINKTPTLIKSNSFRWVRSGCDKTQKLNRLKNPSSPVLGPSLTPSTAGIPLRKRLQEISPKFGARELSTFDTVRSLFYRNCKSTQSPPSKSKIADNKMTTRKSRVYPSVRRHPRTTRTLCDT